VILSDQILAANDSGAFNSWMETKRYVLANGYKVVAHVLISAFVGAAVRGGNKINYLNRVEAGKEPPPSTPVVVPPDTPIVMPAPPAKGTTP